MHGFLGQSVGGEKSHRESPHQQLTQSSQRLGDMLAATGTPRKPGSRRESGNTIQTQLRIMEEKGLVRHRAVGRTFIYRPVYSREQASSRFLDKIFDGAVRDLVMTLLRSRRFGTSELGELERLIAEARRTSEEQQKEKP